MTKMTLGLVEKVRQYAREHAMFRADGTLLLALSGGGDSMALFTVLRQLNVPFQAAHCNFHLRGEDSDNDEQAVRCQCDKYGIVLKVKHFDVSQYKREHGVSTEMACRELRYDWFFRLLDECGYYSLAVAHHSDDNVETFFLNALRGTGVSGLAAMRPVRNRIVRPLLCVSRNEIEEFLKQENVPFVTDRTNLLNDVKRNRLRNVVIPCIEREFPDARARLVSTVANVADCVSLYEEGIDVMREMVVDNVNSEDEIVIDNQRLLSMRNPATLLFEITKKYGFNREQCESAVNDLRRGGAAGNKYEGSGRVMCIYATKLKVLLQKVKVEENCLISLCNNKIEEPIKIEIERSFDTQSVKELCDGKRVIALNSDVLKCDNVVLRHWREGDRLEPFGMRGSKLVSDLFTDLKLGEREKNDVWILEADGKILWVVGYRASRHYAVSAGAPFVLLKAEI